MITTGMCRVSRVLLLASLRLSAAVASLEFKA